MSAFVINPYAFAAFKPTDIAGCVAWFDFSDTATMFTDTAGTTAVSADNDAIARINDKSTGGYDLAQGVLANRPLYKTAIQNSLSIGRFDGSNDRLASASNFSITGSASRTVFSVFKRNDAFNRMIASWGSVASTGGVWGLSSEYGVRVQGANKLYANNGTDGVWSIATARLASTTVDGIEMFFDGGSAATASSTLSGTTTINTASGLIRIGIWVNDGQNIASGDLAEIIIYDSALSTADREAVRDYLNAKWAVY